jgi:transaldolase
MKTYVHTVRGRDQAWARERGLLDGTWVGLIERGAEELDELVEELAGNDQPLHLELPPLDAKKLAAEVRRLRGASDLVVPVLPPTDEALVATRALDPDTVFIAMSCCSPLQALLAAKAGARRVCVPVEVALAGGEDPVAIAATIESLVGAQQLDVEVVLVGVSAPHMLLEAAAAGLPAVAATRAALQGAFAHHLGTALVERLQRGPR